jgi:N utilization substance protein A
MFQRILRAPERFAHAFVRAGYTSIEEVAYVPVDELKRVEGIPDWAMNDLRSRAREYLINVALDGKHPPSAGPIDA